MVTERSTGVVGDVKEVVQLSVLLPETESITGPPTVTEFVMLDPANPLGTVTIMVITTGVLGCMKPISQ